MPARNVQCCFACRRHIYVFVVSFVFLPCRCLWYVGWQWVQNRPLFITVVGVSFATVLSCSGFAHRWTASVTVASYVRTPSGDLMLAFGRHCSVQPPALAVTVVMLLRRWSALDDSISDSPWWPCPIYHLYCPCSMLIKYSLPHMIGARRSRYCWHNGIGRFCRTTLLVRTALSLGLQINNERS